jgi:hypothetical protein
MARGEQTSLSLDVKSVWRETRGTRVPGPSTKTLLVGETSGDCDGLTNETLMAQKQPRISNVAKSADY